MTDSELRAARWEAYLRLAECLNKLTFLRRRAIDMLDGKAHGRLWLEEYARLWRLTNMHVSNAYKLRGVGCEHARVERSYR